jgi:single-stranded-DNA-specific exonuclease
MPYRWTFYPDASRDIVRRLMDGLKISPVLARVLGNRGVASVPDGQRFLSPALSDLHDPFALPGMERAVARISAAIDRRERIGVYGDYDVDGVTGAALLSRFFRDVGGDAIFRVPNRMREGYGLTDAGIDEFARAGVRLLVTVDCGTNSVREIAYARGLGIDTVVADHHTPGESLPEAVAVVNPHLPGSTYPFKHLAGVAIALKVSLAVSRARGLTDERALEDLDLVAVGSIADVAPLVGENRTLVKRGLRVLSESRRTGFRELIRVSGFEGKEIGVWEVAFGLAPRINAAGRIGDARAAVELLTTESVETARERAEGLERENSRRRELDSDILTEALAMVDGTVGLEGRKAIVLSSDRWHPGVIGIAASRVKERYARPTVLIAMDGDLGRGSARSVPGFSLYEALARCSDTLVSFGGHEQAAGFTIERRMIEPFRERFLAHAAERLAGVELSPTLRIDGAVPVTHLGIELYEEVKLLRPFGPENAEPIFIAKGLEPAGRPQIVGRGRTHLKFAVRDGDRRIEAIAFDKAELHATVADGEPIDVAFTLGENNYLGDRQLQLRVKDIHPGGAGDPAGVAPSLESF